MSSEKPTLVIQQTEHMSRAAFDKLMELSKGYAEGLGFKVVCVPFGVSAHVEHGTGALVAALQAQTEAINRLAESNQQVIDYLLSQEAEEAGADLEGPNYLDPDD